VNEGARFLFRHNADVEEQEAAIGEDVISIWFPVTIFDAFRGHNGVMRGGGGGAEAIRRCGAKVQRVKCRSPNALFEPGVASWRMDSSAPLGISSPLPHSPTPQQTVLYIQD
jgi:hypothetical protein